MTNAGYARPELLADTDWLAQHLDDPDSDHDGGESVKRPARRAQNGGARPDIIRRKHPARENRRSA